MNRIESKTIRHCFLSSKLILGAFVILGGVGGSAFLPSALAEELGMDPADLSVPVKRGTMPPARKSARPASPTFAPPPPLQTATQSTATPPASSIKLPSPELRHWGISASLNVPHPFFLEGEYRPSAEWSAGLGLGGVHLQNIQWDGQDLEFNMLAADGRVRWHPWGGSFFAGLALGVQRFSGAVAGIVPVTLVSESGSQLVQVPAVVSADITSLYLTPHAGWFKVYDNGLILGFEFGIQLPVSVRNSVSIDADSTDLNRARETDITATSQYQSMAAQVQDAVDTFGKLPLPYVTAIRLGWMF